VRGIDLEIGGAFHSYFGGALVLAWGWVDIREISSFTFWHSGLF